MKGRSKKVDYHYVRTLYTDISVISPFLYFSFIQLINFKSNYSNSAAEFIIRRVYKVRRITFKKQLTTVEGAIPYRVLLFAYRLPFNDGRRCERGKLNQPVTIDITVQCLPGSLTIRLLDQQIRSVKH